VLTCVSVLVTWTINSLPPARQAVVFCRMAQGARIKFSSLARDGGRRKQSRTGKLVLTRGNRNCFNAKT
jgi:hypothetical protein